MVCYLKFLKIFYRHLFFVFTVRKKSFHLATVKLCTGTSCSQIAHRKAWSLKSEMKFHFCWGVKNVFLTGFNELYLPMQLTV
jgi:hypothetical protein